jgi:hypothetical protein
MWFLPDKGEIFPVYSHHLRRCPLLTGTDCSWSRANRMTRHRAAEENWLFSLDLHYTDSWSLHSGNGSSGWIFQSHVMPLIDGHHFALTARESDHLTLSCGGLSLWITFGFLCISTGVEGRPTFLRHPVEDWGDAHYWRAWIGIDRERLGWPVAERRRKKMRFFLLKLQWKKLIERTERKRFSIWQFQLRVMPGNNMHRLPLSGIQSERGLWNWRIFI